ncbi:MAG TPA: LysR family transcriptional regulator [Symbiobacteriaceae bacterium]|jgi:DNA-binding transcriptional LysR family regulator|nr:LysR family transcriptional regulator [Symbiobacteriaceae bacterium]
MIDSLKIFCLVARYQSFTRAAEEAGLTRPAVSQIIKQLEQQFGVTLLTRSTRAVALTPAGETLVARAEKVLAAYGELEAAMAGARAGARVTLVVGASTLPGESLLPAVLGAFRREHPDVEVQVRVGNTEAILQMVRTGQVTIGLVGQEVADPLLASQPVASDEIVLALPPGMRVPDPLPLGELKRLPLISREQGSATRRVVEAELGRHGVPVQALPAVAELGSPEALKAAVRGGMGAAFLSRSQLGPGELSFVRLAGIDLRRPICAVWRRDRPPEAVAQDLMTHLVSTAHGQEG